MQKMRFSGRVDLANVSHLLIDLRIKKDVHQHVWINSNGGFINFFPLLNGSFNCLQYTAVGEKVCSAAIILFLYGQERLAFPDSTFFFHDVRSRFENGEWVTVSDLETCMEYMDDAKEFYGKSLEEIAKIHHDLHKGQEWMIDFIVQHSTITADKLRILMNEEATLTAQEALEYGMVHRIISRDELLC